MQDILIGTLVNGGKGTASYIEQILPHGFESFSITFWQTTGGINLRKLAEEVNKVLDGTGAIISSLGIFGNPLCKGAKDKETLKGWRELIDNAHHFNCDIVAGFTGRLRDEPIDKSIPVFKKVFNPLAKRAKDKGVRLAFENCDMGGTWDRGDWNIAQTPKAWDMMFDAIPLDNIGLEWEPCHQLVKLIDPMPQLRKYVNKIFHVHGKDATVHHDVIREHGVRGPVAFAHHRTPGFGDSNWTDIISDLRMAGFKGSIDIEGWHDPVYRGELEMTGQVHALNYLKNCRGGDYIENPK
ncbi:MAG: sugar phosphate isomerase/epimerase [Planctomycetes bacterium]|nr:sugar phosphate isomerase/epimerase [Planctomycetota bacterium]